jgi:hypothetical protein
MLVITYTFNRKRRRRIRMSRWGLISMKKTKEAKTGFDL